MNQFENFKTTPEYELGCINIGELLVINATRNGCWVDIDKDLANLVKRYIIQCKK